MKKIKVENIQNGDILAKDILSKNYRIILSEGTALKKEYIDKISELGIEEVFIKEAQEEHTSEKRKVGQEAPEAIREEVKKKFKTQVQKVLERHVYSQNDDLKILSQTADTIIDDILDDENLVEEVIEIKERSADLYEHSINCCVMSTILALRLGVDKKKIRELSMGCLIHDLGLRFMSGEFINIDIEELPPNKRSQYKKHVVLGYSSLQDETWLPDLSKKIIIQHHERLDGSGYPFHLKSLNQEIMIMAICDEFDEMISGIGHKQLKVSKAVDVLKSFKNTKFDGKIVDEFLKITAVYQAGTKVLLNTGQRAIVVKQNKDCPEKPIIRMTHEKNGKPFYVETIINMAEDNTLSIESEIN